MSQHSNAIPSLCWVNRLCLWWFCAPRSFYIWRGLWDQRCVTSNHSTSAWADQWKLIKMFSHPCSLTTTPKLGKGIIFACTDEQGDRWWGIKVSQLHRLGRQVPITVLSLMTRMATEHRVTTLHYASDYLERASNFPQPPLLIWIQINKPLPPTWKKTNEENMEHNTLSAPQDPFLLPRT